MTTEPKYTDAQVQSIIDRVTRENSADGMDGDSWDRLLVRAALSERQASMLHGKRLDQAIDAAIAQEKQS